ncbi:hypothetical protein N779_22280 [Vibrio coralliilyticus OCN008]|nr:hypothetical protein N779_22280 [Vibrio coralliilyticus OCN008]
MAHLSRDYLRIDDHHPKKEPAFAGSFLEIRS